jgi:endo-1,4-beta-xylanase
MRPRKIVPWLVAPALAVVGVFVVVNAAHAAGPLRTVTPAGKFIGAALATDLLSNNTTYRNIAATEFNQVTPENAMKWDTTEPNQNQFNFTGADQIVNFASQNGQIVHGHTLVWHQQTPGWVQGLSATNMRAAMQNHITTEVGRYASNPVVQSWDVVNEAFNDDGTRRQSFWQNTLGDGYIADAFRFARAADADARLCYNDFNAEGMNAKSNAIFNMVSSFLQQGVPINCVGFQTHLGTQFSFPSQMQANLQRFADLGLQVRITELDVRSILPMDATKTQTQMTYYTNVVNACKAVTACAGITIWGIDDGHSWIPQTFPDQGSALLWDAGFNKKPVYDTVANALGGGGGDTQAPSVPGTPTAGTVTSTSITINWTASTDNVGVTGYDIFRAPGTSGGTFASVGTSTTNSFTNTGLTAGQTFRYQVRARDAAGNVSAFSASSAPITTSGGGTGACSVTPTTQTVWDTGYVINPATVTNTSTSTINSWTLTVTLPIGHSYAGSWNATVTTSGSPSTGVTITAKSISWNSVLSPGQSTASFGFQAGRPSGNTALPSGYTCTSP